MNAIHIIMATSSSANPHNAPNTRIESLARKRKISAVTFLSLFQSDWIILNSCLHNCSFRDFTHRCWFSIGIIWKTKIFCFIHRFWVRFFSKFISFNLFSFQWYWCYICFYVLDISWKNSYCITKTQCWTYESKNSFLLFFLI